MTLVAAGAAGFAASWAGLDVSLARVTISALDHSRSWASLPEEVPMPAAAPDDPSAYRGVRFRRLSAVRGDLVETGGQVVPWLRAYAGNGTYFGDQLVLDGRRRMVWFFRGVEPPAFRPSPQQPAEPPLAVLDVLVLPDTKTPDVGFVRGCGPDEDGVIIVGDDGWRLNRSSGRIEPIDPDDARCPED